VEAGTIVGALASILTGTVLILGTMIVVGDIYANSPIFPGLIGSLVAYLAGSLLSKPTPEPIRAEWDRRITSERHYVAPGRRGDHHPCCLTPVQLAQRSFIMSQPTPPIGPVDATRIPRYAGPATFARLPRIDEVSRADVAVLGVPFDSGVSYRPGARFGPGHIRASSKLLRPYNPAQDVSPFGVLQVADAGDVAVNPFDLSEAVQQIDTAVTGVRADGTTVLSLGGDHTIALPILRSLSRDHGPIAVLHFDAHLDTWDTYFGAPYTHGTPFRRASEEGLLDLERCLHMGTRGPLYADTDLEDDTRLGFSIVRADDYETDGVPGAVQRMRRRLGDGPVYVSIDIDVLDPAHAPGTGTPEAGGLTSRELLNTLRGLAGLNIVGADIVEVAPVYDHAEITGIAASHVAYELISVLAKDKS
jgi:agmatinase